MQKNKIILLIRLISLIVAGSTLYIIFTNKIKIWWYFLHGILHGYNLFKGNPLWSILIMILFDTVVILKLVSAYGLFRIRLWGRIVAIVVLSFDFLVRLAGAINTWTYNIRHPELPPIPENTTLVEVISMWPSYIIGIISLLSVIILLSRPVKEIMKEKIAQQINSANPSLACGGFEVADFYVRFAAKHEKLFNIFFLYLNNYCML